MKGSLAERLRVLRAQEGLTLNEASAKIGVNRHTLRDLELGKREPYGPTLRKIAEAYNVSLAQLLEEPALAGAGKAEPPWTGRAEVVEPALAPLGKFEAPDTGLTALSPAELETRVFGAPVREGEEPKPIIDAREADALAQQIRLERNAILHGLEQYADAPSSARFAARAAAEEAEKRALWAQVYRLFLIDVWSKLADPRDVPFKGILQLAGLADETFGAAVARVEERDRARRTEDRAG
jgi:transcriptional regulator with XRE-family HTH domain